LLIRALSLVAIAATGVVGVLCADAYAVELGPVSVPVTVPPLTVGPVAVNAPGGASQPIVSVTLAPPPGTPVAITITPPPRLQRDPLLPVQSGPVPSSSSSASASSAPAASSASGASASVSSSSSSATAAPPHRVQMPDARASAAIGDASLPISASLRQPGSDGTWGLLREAASARGLWLALAIILLVAQYFARGLLRDAIRRARLVSSA